MSNTPRPKVWAWLLTWGILAMLVYSAGKNRAANPDRPPKGICARALTTHIVPTSPHSRGKNPRSNTGLSRTGIWPWIFTWAIIGAFVYTTLVNPDELLGQGGTVNLLVFKVQTYQGQGSALQFTGTFIVALGLVTRLNNLREINKMTISGIIGGIGVMVGLLMQIILENPPLALVPILMLFYVSLVWILLVALYGILRFLQE